MVEDGLNSVPGIVPAVASESNEADVSEDLVEEDEVTEESVEGDALDENVEGSESETSGAADTSLEESGQEEMQAEESSDDEDDQDSPQAPRRSNRRCTAARKFTYPTIGGNPVMTTVGSGTTT